MPIFTRFALEWYAVLRWHGLRAVLPSRGIVSRRDDAAPWDMTPVWSGRPSLWGLDKSGDMFSHAPHPKHGYAILSAAMPHYAVSGVEADWLS
ncbi:MAG: hypothetical protein Q8N47_01745 [Bryobacterales bacterium]|nr:hypothetical protein [Bryobacterales bacterium]